MPHYSVLVHVDPDAQACSWWSSNPARSGRFTQDHSIEEALEPSHDAVGLHLEGLTAAGEPTPDEPMRPLPHVVAVAGVAAPVGT